MLNRIFKKKTSTKKSIVKAIKQNKVNTEAPEIFITFMKQMAEYYEWELSMKNPKNEKCHLTKR